MQILIETDRNITQTAQQDERTERALRSAIGRFEHRLTRIQIHLSDVNSNKGGSDDKRCLIEARPEGLDPLAVNHHAPTIELAIDGACVKMGSALDSLFGRLDGRRPDGAASLA